MQIAILVHGGAGAWDLDTEDLDGAVAACAVATAAARALLIHRGSALDAVEAAVRILEDDPTVEAGRGSRPNRIGEVEMDALIMDGRTLEMGAVAAIQRVRNPISLARRVMVDTEHNFLVGKGADAFADRIGFPRYELAELLAGYPARPTGPERGEGERMARSKGSGDTVGAVAIDVHGNVAVGTSTGGTERKLPGRVGDSPLVGSGGYADNWTAAASATGHGEDLMKVVISKRVCDYVASGLSAQAACDSAIRLLAERVNGRGGVIAVDARGRLGVAFNTAAMPHAHVAGEGEIICGR
jgi:beta-aspartyl-peptidase (threonine type)